MKISEWLQEYNPQNSLDAENALREIMQEVTLAGLSRSGFFKDAAFYGGTALRIFHGLNRFSEDLDFSLLATDRSFDILRHLDAVVEEFRTLGMEVRIKTKPKSKETAIDSAFLKQDTSWNELILDETFTVWGLSTKPNLKIKVEVDREPPAGFDTEELLLTKPFSFYVKCYTLSDLFAGKMHALLFRQWKQRVKGRDWFDMEWYIRKGVPLHLDHFLQRARNSKDWSSATITEDDFLELIRTKIEKTSMEAVKDDVIRFIPDTAAIEIWSKQYFLDLVKLLKFRQP